MQELYQNDKIKPRVRGGHGVCIMIYSEITIRCAGLPERAFCLSRWSRIS